jgi:hypothetical protein
MSGADAPRAPSRQRLVNEALRAVWRSRVAWVLAAMAVAVAIGGALYVNSLWAKALSPSCAELPPSDLTIEQLISLKARKMDYLRAWSEDRGAAMEMSPDEINTLVRGEIAFGLHVVAEGEQVQARLTIPADPGCYNVEFRGKVAIEDRQARLWPERLVVGETDLTFVVGGRELALAPANLEGRLDPRLAGMLANTARLTVEDGRFRFRLFDNDAMW